MNFLAALEPSASHPPASRTCQQTFWLMLSFSNLWVFVYVLITHLKTKESKLFLLLKPQVTDEIHLLYRRLNEQMIHTPKSLDNIFYCINI